MSNSGIMEYIRLVLNKDYFICAQQVQLKHLVSITLYTSNSIRIKELLLVQIRKRVHLNTVRICVTIYMVH